MEEEIISLKILINRKQRLNPVGVVTFLTVDRTLQVITEIYIYISEHRYSFTTNIETFVQKNSHGRSLGDSRQYMVFWGMHIKHSFLHTKHGFMHTNHTSMLSMHSFMHTYCRKSCIFNNFSVLKTQKCFAKYESERIFLKFHLDVEILNTSI